MSQSSEHAFAIVESVEADGLRLKFDGEDTAGEKTYKCNTFFKFTAGDRVYCVKDSGTFVAICKIGEPAQSIAADTAKTAESAKTATSADSAKTVDTAKKADKSLGVTDSDTDYYHFLFRGYYNSNITEYCRTYEDEGLYYRYWMQMGAPIDEACDYKNTDAIVRFRSSGDGKLQFLLPYRNSYTWYTIATQ